MSAKLTGQRHADAGLSLIELVVAILILSIATIATFRVLDFGVRQSYTEKERVFAETVALNRVAELRLGETGLRDVVALAGKNWSVETTESATEAGLIETEVVVKTEDGRPAARVVAFIFRGAAL